MLQSYRFRGWVNWAVIRAHLCTAALGACYNGAWRTARVEAPLPWALLVSAALPAVALPATLLHLAVGQLSQQDAVGVWRAVPFFRGVGYIRLMVSFVGATYTAIYLALTIAYFLYTATHEIPFADCVEWIDTDTEEEIPIVMNATECLSNTFMAPVGEKPSYYLAVALILIVLWVISPFVFYNPVKWMKRILYILTPLVLILAVVILSSIGDRQGLSSFLDRDWTLLTEPQLWLSAVVQALWSNHIAGGYLIPAGDSVYSSTNVQWTSLAITGSSLASTWFWLVFWSAVGTGQDASVAAPLVRAYQAAMDRRLADAWPLLLYLILMLAGIISMLFLVYPLMERVRRVGGIKWRVGSFVLAVLGAGGSLGVLAGGQGVIALLVDVAAPLAMCAATVAEVGAFASILMKRFRAAAAAAAVPQPLKNAENICWRNLLEDIEFLIGSEVARVWVYGWWMCPVVIVLVLCWWVTAAATVWTGAAATAAAAAATVGIVFVAFALVAVTRQVQYDICGKLKSSFAPTRHWGPRDPITHYYWLARRDDVGGGPRARYNRRQLGQLSTRPSFLTVTHSVPSEEIIEKVRSNSDEWIYTTYRREQLPLEYSYTIDRKRSKSLDWDVPIRCNKLNVESNNNTRFQYSSSDRI